MKRVWVRRRVWWRAACAGMAVLLAGCGRGREAAAPETRPATVVLEPGDVAVARLGRITEGPTVSGSLQAATEAILRARLQGTVSTAAAEEGQRVAEGTLLARISDPRLSAQSHSAESGVRSAEVSVINARRDVDRYQTLVTAGASPRRELESARSALASAQAQLASARAQQADVQSTIADARVRAPITGIVSSRSVSEGDVVQVGAELYRVVDPSSMRLEATVPSKQLGAARVGASVVFQVRGYPGRTFTGRVRRVSPTADPATRQVKVFVSLPNPDGTLVAGLFAEGRLATKSRRGVMVPADAVATEDGRSHVMRVRKGTAAQVRVTLGVQDDATRRVEIVSGVAAGDTVLVGPALDTAPGSLVRVEAPRPPGAP